ncbi:MAG: hypothetical protein ABL925_00605 [Methylococcales bacterium]
MKKNNLIMLLVAMTILTIAAFKVSNAESTEAENDSKEEKTVAWYVANSKEARDQNKECHDNPNLQSTPNCVNSLHALQISFAGGAGRR